VEIGSRTFTYSDAYTPWRNNEKGRGRPGARKRVAWAGREGGKRRCGWGRAVATARKRAMLISSRKRAMLISCADCSLGKE
jgi:hypothetical protein